MKPYYQDKWVIIYHGDCREILPELPKVDLVLTDPPYGLRNTALGGHKVHDRLGDLYGDDEDFDPRPFLGIGIEHIIWGANHFANLLPNQTRWLVWVKHGEGLWGKRDHAPFELAWTDLGGSGRAFRWIWDGSIKQGRAFGLQHIHPTEKPIELMKWCISLSKTNGIILDPFMGSGTSVVASKEHNRYSIGIEIEEKYCEIAANRCSQSVMEFNG